MKSGPKAATASSASGDVVGGFEVPHRPSRQAGSGATGDRVGIAVDAEQLEPAAAKRLGVAAAAQGGIHPARGRLRPP